MRHERFPFRRRQTESNAAVMASKSFTRGAVYTL
jgi:hypothetical protein